MDQPPVDSTRLQRIARAYTESATLYAALDLRLFSHVAAGAGNIDELARAMDVTPLNAERLVTACVAMGLLRQSEGRLANAADAERYLVEGAPGYAGAWMTFTRPTVADWFALTERLRSKAPPILLGNFDDLTVAEARA